MTQVARITISLPKDMISFADKIANERGIGRSKVISLWLQEIAEQHRLAELEEGYKAMAEEHRQFAAMALASAHEVVPEWK
ncbi:MAG: hypothetical protein Q7K41_03825 [Dehalococcoidales bacterium]|nr:hypothetical protein [Dehalococcoidales bacterium]